MLKYTTTTKTHTYLVYDREALRRKAYELAAERDKDISENHPELKGRFLSHREHLKEAEAASAEAGDESDIEAWFDEAFIAADDPEADGDG